VSTNYKLDRFNSVTLDGATLPVTYNAGVITALDQYSPAVIEFIAWVALGNVPAPADPEPPQNPSGVAAQNARALASLADSDPVAAKIVEVLKTADLI
jgi:hypothetical protein